MQAFQRFLDQAEGHRIPFLAGIWPLTSYRNAEFMNNEVPGVEIPDHIMQRMLEAEEAGRGTQEGVKIAQEMVQQLRADIQGIQVSAPFGKIELALEVVDAL